MIGNVQVNGDNLLQNHFLQTIQDHLVQDNGGDALAFGTPRKAGATQEGTKLLEPSVAPEAVLLGQPKTPKKMHASVCRSKEKLLDLPLRLASFQFISDSDTMRCWQSVASAAMSTIRGFGCNS